MLRISFLPSDYNPQLLILGAKSDLAGFAGVLRAFGDTGMAVDLGAISGAAADVQVTLAEPELNDAIGLWPLTDQCGQFHWRLPRGVASAFAEDVDLVVAGKEPAGTAVLECQVRGEIPVKATTGEWEDAFFERA